MLASVVQMVKCVSQSFWHDRPEFEPAFCQFFPLPFQISYHIRKAFIFNKIEGNNKKVVNKISVRVGVGRVLLSQYCGIHLINVIKIIIYTQYIIIAYCFIMYYNTEVQIIATICNK